VRYVTFAVRSDPQQLQPGALMGEVIVSFRELLLGAQDARNFPPGNHTDSMFEYICAGETAWRRVEELITSMEDLDSVELQSYSQFQGRYRLDEVNLYPPLPQPMSLRDFYAFEQHVTAANQIRGRNVPQEWYQFPVFYFTNPNTIIGPDEEVPYPSYTKEMDFELEVGCIIGKPGINIPAEEAEEYIFGFTIFNDWSARDIQRKEMKVGLGPAKGKDFASSLGPWIATLDELSDRSTGRPGVFDLEMVARINGEERSYGNWKELYYSFGEMIARASQDVYLLPGEVIGSGTVGTGCLLELTRAQGPWLKPGDIVELEIERLGILRNRISEKHAK
jgi:fumarylacetoacetate (FAA) hydrolase